MSAVGQRILAFVVLVSAVISAIALSVDSWARARFIGLKPDFGAHDRDPARHFDLTLGPQGQVHVGKDTANLTDLYNRGENRPYRALLEGAIPGSLRSLALVLAIIVAIAAFIAMIRPLQHLAWVLVSATGLVALALLVVLHEHVVSTLRSTTTAMNLAEVHTSALGWSTWAIVAASVATIAAALIALPGFVKPAKQQPPTPRETDPTYGAVV